jgi:hypothetical protein
VAIISGDRQWAAVFGARGYGIGAGPHPMGWWLVGLVALATVSFAVLRLLVPDNDAALFAFLPLLAAVLLVRLVTWPPMAYVALAGLALAELALVACCFARRRGG